MILEKLIDRLKNLKPRWLWISGGIIGFLFIYSLILLLTLPNVTWLKKENPVETAMMKYRQEQESEKIDKNIKSSRTKTVKKLSNWTRLSRISPYLIQSVLIAEDDKFYQHEGFDWEEINESLEKNIDKGQIMRGGSTITQQLAKNLFLKPTRNPFRKIREALIAHKLEKELTKNRILELYLNVIEWGTNIYGIGPASRAYFNKTPGTLSVSEAIRLASILPNPHRFSATSNQSRRMQIKRRLIVNRMLRRHAISQEQYDQALIELGF
ncbi:monofunctional biosynthetic peptidoglycan transglycosylase, partial [candidate division KSB1 bacterium]|nr:monofunctional biosynthetic peptidoglycan transglycosylase [candidate division KSB1 bacterium]